MDVFERLLVMAAMGPCICSTVAAVITIKRSSWLLMACAVTMCAGIDVRAESVVGPTARASSEVGAAYGAAMAVDGDASTGWSCGQRTGWLELDLGKETLIATAFVMELKNAGYLPTKNIASTRKGNTIYLHITAWPEDTCKLPALAAKIRKSSLLTGGAVNVSQTADGLEIAVPKSDRQAMDTIVVLELDTPAIQIEPINVKDERSVPK